MERVIVATEEGFEKWDTGLPKPVDYEAFIKGKPTRYEWPEIDENSPLGLCYTSGTTGNPKGVEYEHRSQYLHTMAQCMTDSMGLSGTDTLCGIVPMFHAQGWGLPWSATMLGMKQVMPSRYMDPTRLAALMAAEGVTISAGVPTIWQGIKAAYEANPGKYDLSKLSRLTCGGSSPPPSLIRWYWDTLGVEMIQGWGMTETSPLATLSRRVMKRSQLKLTEDQRFANVAKAGQLMPGLEIDIFDEQFKRLPHDGETVGEILIRGPWICSEYYKDRATGQISRRLVDHRRRRQDRPGGISDHQRPLEGSREERRRVDFVGRPRESHRRPRRRCAGVRRRPAASEVGRAADRAGRQEARQRRRSERRSSRIAQRSSRSGNCPTTCCSSKRFR